MRTLISMIYAHTHVMKCMRSHIRSHGHIHAHTHFPYTHTCIFAQPHENMCTRACTCTRAGARIRGFAYAEKCLHLRVATCQRTYTNMHTHMYTHTHTHAHKRACTQTHKQTHIRAHIHAYNHHHVLTYTQNLCRPARIEAPIGTLERAHNCTHAYNCTKTHK
jgi:hypothetical protein